MTSPDGITWTARTAAVSSGWFAVTYGNGTFVAVAFTGAGSRVMTSPDGITWTARTAAAQYNWNGVTFANGQFVAVAFGTSNGNAVMTSGTSTSAPPVGTPILSGPGLLGLTSLLILFGVWSQRLRGNV
jgi:hypothetical protein